MKLYLLTIRMMVVAAEKNDVLYAAGSADFDACDSEIEEITEEDDILLGWENVLPWGDQGNFELECAEIVKRRGKQHENKKPNA